MSKKSCVDYMAADLCAELELASDWLGGRGAKCRDVAVLLGRAAIELGAAIDLLDEHPELPGAEAWIKRVTKASEHSVTRPANLSRVEQYAYWRDWAFDPECSESETMLRIAVSGAWLRMAADERPYSPQVDHAMQQLEAARHGKGSSWP